MISTNTAVYDGRGGYAPVLDLPFLEAFSGNIFVQAITNSRNAGAYYSVANNAQGFVIRFISGDDVFDPKVLRNGNKTTLFITCKILGASVNVVLINAFTHMSYTKAIYGQGFKPLSTYTQNGYADLSIKMGAYQDFKTITIGPHWTDREGTYEPKSSCTVSNNIVTVGINVLRNTGDFSFDEKIIGGLPVTNNGSGGFLFGAYALNNGKVFLAKLILDQSGNIRLIDPSLQVQAGYDKTQNLVIFGSITYPIISNWA